MQTTLQKATGDRLHATTCTKDWTAKLVSVLAEREGVHPSVPLVERLSKALADSMDVLYKATRHLSITAGWGREELRAALAKNTVVTDPAE